MRRTAADRDRVRRSSASAPIAAMVPSEGSGAVSTSVFTL
jgi:hypothetical protein